MSCFSSTCFYDRTYLMMFNMKKLIGLLNYVENNKKR